MNTYTYTYIYIYVHICMYIYVYTYVHIYTYLYGCNIWRLPIRSTIAHVPASTKEEIHKRGALIAGKVWRIRNYWNGRRVCETVETACRLTPLPSLTSSPAWYRAALQASPPSSTCAAAATCSCPEVLASKRTIESQELRQFLVMFMSLCLWLPSRKAQVQGAMPQGCTFPCPLKGDRQRLTALARLAGFRMTEEAIASV